MLAKPGHDDVPEPIHVPGARVRLPDRHPYVALVADVGRRDVNAWIGVDDGGECVGRFVPFAVCEADERQMDGRDTLQRRLVVHPLCEVGRKTDVLRDVMSNPAHAVVAEDPPKLERAETTTERDVPVAVVDDGTRLARLVP